MSQELQKSFPKAILLLSMGVFAALQALTYFGILHSTLGFNVLSPLFFGLFSFLFHRQLMKAEAERYQKLINTYLGGSMLRLLLGALVLFISIKAFHQIPIMELGAIFVVLYVLYIFFEALFVAKQLRAK